MNQKLSYLVIRFPLCTFAAKRQFLLFLSYISRAGSSLNTRCQEQVVHSYTQAAGQAQGAPSAHCNSIALSLSKSPACFSREGKNGGEEMGREKMRLGFFLHPIVLLECSWEAPLEAQSSHSSDGHPLRISAAP